jgi:hypothetical protein
MRGQWQLSAALQVHWLTTLPHHQPGSGTTGHACGIAV